MLIRVWSDSIGFGRGSPGVVLFGQALSADMRPMAKGD